MSSSIDIKTVVATTPPVGLPLVKNQDNAEKINFCENGDVKNGSVVHSKKDKGIVGRENVEFPCLDIIEPELNPEANAAKEDYITSVLATFEKSLERTKQNLGYALRLDFDYSALGQLPNQVINNFGDPFIESNFNGQSRKFEVGVLDWFARLWEIEKDEYWGYVTNGGSEGNLHGILLGRELFPEGIFYTSKDSHFSVFKAARMYRMKCVTIDTHVSGQIDCADFRAKLLQNIDKPAIVNVIIGTTMKGAIDDVDLVIQTLEECGFQHDRFYIHCDGALYGFMLPLLEGVAPKITFKKPIGSISVSGHKYIGCPMPCGIQMTRIKYINVLSREVEYIGTRDATITCSRSGHTPIYLWYALNRKGHNGLKQDFEKCLRNAKYLKELLKEAGVSVMLNEPSSIVVFEHPRDDDLIRRWQLSCEGSIAHVVVMPSDTIEKLYAFYKDIVASWTGRFRNGVNKPMCVASYMGERNCVCAQHKDY